MRRMLKTSTCLKIGMLAALAAGLFASDAMPAAQQNSLVRKYCAVCHTDAARNGGLSLEHFDAAHVAPSLAAMMVSKLTSGIPLATVKASVSDPSAAARVARKMKSGAMSAAGIPIPDNATINALISALASETTGADEWFVNRTQDPDTKAPMLTASILREVPSAKTVDEASMYRMVVTCNAATRQGEMQLSWAPGPRLGTLSAIVDGEATFTYKVESAKTMGAAISLYESGKDFQTPAMVLPMQTLGVNDFFPNESVEFPFEGLTQTTRQSLAACFKESGK